MNERFTLTSAQRRLLEIIASVETGIYTAEEAVEVLGDLRQDAEKAGLGFRADYTLADFQRIRSGYLSQWNEHDEADDGFYMDDEA